MFRSSYLDHGFLLAAARSRVAVDHGDRVAVAVVGRTAICPLLQKDSMEMRDQILGQPLVRTAEVCNDVVQGFRIIPPVGFSDALF